MHPTRMQERRPSLKAVTFRLILEWLQLFLIVVNAQ